MLRYNVSMLTYNVKISVLKILEKRHIFIKLQNYEKIVELL